MNKIAKTLRTIAPHVLRSRVRLNRDVGMHVSYICDHLLWEPLGREAGAFLQSLGMGNNLEQFSEFDADRQEVRYCWLMFAADIAEEWNA